MSRDITVPVLLERSEKLRRQRDAAVQDNQRLRKMLRDRFPIFDYRMPPDVQQIR